MWLTKNGIIKDINRMINILKGRISMLRRKRKTEHYTYEARDVSHYIIVYSNNKDYGVSILKLMKIISGILIEYIMKILSLGRINSSYGR